jgi:hypothetical protein
LALVAGTISWFCTDLIRTHHSHPTDPTIVPGPPVVSPIIAGGTRADVATVASFDFSRASTEPLAAILRRLFTLRTAEDSLNAWRHVILATAATDADKAFQLINAMPDAIAWEAQGKIVADVFAKTGAAGVASALRSHIAPRLVMEGISQLNPGVLLPYLQNYLSARPEWTTWDVSAWGKLYGKGAEDDRKCWELVGPRIHELLKGGHPISDLASGIPPAFAAEFLLAIENPFSRSSAAAELSARTAGAAASDPDKVSAYLTELDQAAGRSEKSRGVKLLAQSMALSDKSGSAVLTWVRDLATTDQKEAAIASASYVFSDSRLIEKILADLGARQDSVILEAALTPLAASTTLTSEDVSGILDLQSRDRTVAELLMSNGTWQNILKKVSQPR